MMMEMSPDMEIGTSTCLRSGGYGGSWFGDDGGTHGSPANKPTDDMPPTPLSTYHRLGLIVVLNRSVRIGNVSTTAAC